MAEHVEMRPDEVEAAAGAVRGHAEQVEAHGRALVSGTAGRVGHGPIGEVVEQAVRRGMRAMAEGVTGAVKGFYHDTADGLEHAATRMRTVEGAAQRDIETTGQHATQPSIHVGHEASAGAAGEPAPGASGIREALEGTSARSGSSAEPGSWLAGLSVEDRASYDRLKGAVGRASSRTAEEFRAGMSDEQLAAGRRKPHLRAMFAGSDIERAAARDPAVAGDANITHLGTSKPGQAVADFHLGAGHALDVTGGSASSVSTHMSRPYITDRDQILTYPSLSQEFLKETFE